MAITGTTWDDGSKTVNWSANKINIKKSLKRLIDENPDIFNEILTEMRAEKIQKIRNRK